MLRFKANILAKWKKNLNEIKLDNLTVADIEESKKVWLLYEQTFIVNKDNFLKVKNSLQLFSDQDNLLGVKTRISDIETFLYDKKYPVLLNSGSYFTKLVILNAHISGSHSGVASTLSFIRSNYWIVRERQVAKSSIQKCFLCKYVQGKVLLGPETPTLPEFRIKCNHSFEFVEVDYAGPIYFTFTCWVTRATNLEITVDLGKKSLLLALGRLLAKRGQSKLIISYNFKIFKSERVKDFLRNNNIEWKFILERSPWWGGLYERLIGITKSCLKNVMAKGLLTFEELRTVIYEIECS